MLRLHKFLAQCGVASRRKAEELIADGRVCVNSKTAVVGDTIDPDKDNVTFDGNEVKLSEKVYIVLNKPRGVVTTVKDTHGRHTVIDYIDGVKARVFPVGRLDLDVGGTLILTNDGELAHRLMHPSYKVNKVYVAWVDSILTEETAAKLEKGVELEDGITAPAEVSILKKGPHATRVQLVLHEGRKREVKRILASVNHPVIKLTRISVGGVEKGNLTPGQWRYLNDDKIDGLRKLVGLDTE